MNVIISVGNISKLLAPFILGRVRLRDPYVKKSLKKLYQISFKSSSNS
jgi:hypothetical protein